MEGRQAWNIKEREFISRRGILLLLPLRDCFLKGSGEVERQETRDEEESAPRIIVCPRANEMARHSQSPVFRWRNEDDTSAEFIRQSVRTRLQPMGRRPRPIGPEFQQCHGLFLAERGATLSRDSQLTSHPRSQLFCSLQPSMYPAYAQ